MKTTSKLLSVILAAVMLITVCTTVIHAEDDNDIHYPKYQWADITSDSWYYESANMARLLGFTYGTTISLDTPAFEPDSLMTREQFITVLLRLSKHIFQFADVQTFGSTFSDYNAKAWGAGAIAWAEKHGLTNGVSDTLFGVGRPVTREEIVTWLYRYVELKQLILPEAADAVSSFKDSADVSSWAVDAVELMKNAGIIKGDENGMFNPKKVTTRAEGFAIITRFYTAIKLDFEKTFAPGAFDKAIVGTPDGSKEITDPAVIDSITSHLRTIEYEDSFLGDGIADGYMAVRLYNTAANEVINVYFPKIVLPGEDGIYDFESDNLTIITGTYMSIGYFRIYSAFEDRPFNDILDFLGSIE